MDDLRAALARAIQLAEQVIKWADQAQTCRQDCQDLKARVERVTTLLREAAARAADLYERPARRILEDAVKALDKAGLQLVRCRGHGGFARCVVVFPAGSFKKTGHLLDNCIGDLAWVLRLHDFTADAAANDEEEDELIPLPPIALSESILFLVWVQIAILRNGGLEARAAVAAHVASFASANDSYGRLVVEEDGVPALLRLVKDGSADAQESASLAIGLLVRQQRP